MKGKKELPVGTAFLHGTAGKDELFRMHKSEKDAKAAIRLLAYHMRKCGASIYDIAEKLSRPYGTVRYWLVRAHKHGLEGRFDIKHGAPCRLDKKQIEQLLRTDLIKGPDNCGFKATTWTGSLVIAHVKKKFGITYAETSMYDLLPRIGFSCRKPRPKHPKSASEPEKKEFEEKTGRCTKYYSKKGYTVMIGDEVGVYPGVERQEHLVRHRKAGLYAVQPVKEEVLRGLFPNSICLAQSACFSEFLPFCTPDQ